MKSKQWVVAVALVLGLASVGNAQTVLNPTEVEFTASADHALTFPDGAPIVARYEIRFFQQGASAPVSTADLGKPVPDAAQKITLPLADKLVGVPFSPTVQYVAVVAAIGPTGEGVSAASNPFYRIGAPKAPAGVLIKAVR